MSRFVRLLRATSGATAAEFAMVLPLLALFLVGMIDAGRLMWEINKAEKATQMGVRYAVDTDPVMTELYTHSFAQTGEVLAGSAVPTTNFDKVTCTSSSCTCLPVAASICGTVTRNGTAFTNIYNRMHQIDPLIGTSNVKIEYKNVGLGFAGDPNGPDVSALVTVQLQNLSFRPLVLFGSTSFTLPSFSSGLTLEDASGSTSN